MTFDRKHLLEKMEKIFFENYLRCFSSIAKFGIFLLIDLCLHDVYTNQTHTHTHTKKSKQQVLFHLVGDSFSPSMDSKKKTNLLQKVVFKYVFFFVVFVGCIK